MIIGVPREIKTEEYRVGVTPAGVRELTGRGHKVLVQSSAGVRIGLTDEDYVASGAQIVSRAADVFTGAELIVKVKEPQLDECRLLRPEQTLFTYLHLAAAEDITHALIKSRACCIAYETITDTSGRLPLLTPMSEVAGRMSIQAAAHYLEVTQGGSGILLAGVPGVAPGKVLVLGAGVVGRNAVQMAVGLGAEVVVLDKSAPRMGELEQIFGNQIRTLFSSQEEIERQLKTTDVVIGAALVTGSLAPRLVTRDMLKLMRPGSVIVDVAIDQGGCFETSRPTTHSDPVYKVEEVTHYCVANMPGAVPRTSTFALTNVTLPVLLRLADKGVAQALRADEGLLHGLNVYKGHVTHEAVADALNLTCQDPLTMLG